ncbi:hypothetical protein PG994_005151 [Apiospora phragmitis]|uniref:Uncharacterized protein n=1 Tax=Apiospora phragmitis TaxID=2905665 RepID=A0ABR1VSQ8_9PEZI
MLGAGPSSPHYHRHREVKDAAQCSGAILVVEMVIAGGKDAQTREEKRIERWNVLNNKSGEPAFSTTRAVESLVAWELRKGGVLLVLHE